MATHTGSLEAPLTVESQKRMRVDEFPLLREERWPGWPGDNVFRLLVPAHKVGAIIGRKGEFVKRMCEETKSRIKILDGIIGTAERVVLVSAREEPEAIMSPAVDGLLKVHQRTLGLIEGVEGHPCTTVDLHCPVSSRLLVAATQAGSLIGKQGSIIKSIQDASGATVRIMPPEDLPLCALQDDRIVEMHGEPVKVHKAIELAVSYLRKFLVDRSVLPLFELNRAYQAQIQSQVASEGTWASAAAPVPAVNPPNLGGTSYYDPSSYHHNNFYQTPNSIEIPQQHEGVSLYGRDPSVGSIVTAPVVTQNSITGLVTPSAVPDTTAPSGASYTPAPSNHSYIVASSKPTYNAVPSYNSVDAGGYLPYTQTTPVYSSTTGTVGHSTGAYSSNGGAFSF